MKSKTSLGIHLSVDANILFEYWQWKRTISPAVSQLTNWAATGVVTLCVSERIREDIPNPPLSNYLKIRCGNAWCVMLGEVMVA